MKALIAFWSYFKKWYLVEISGKQDQDKKFFKDIFEQDVWQVEKSIKAGKGSNLANIHSQLPFVYKPLKHNSLQALFNCDINPNFVDDQGQTALHIACTLSNSKIVEKLLIKGANPNAVNSKGNSALHLACLPPDIHLITVLLNNGANVNKLNQNDETPLMLATFYGNMLAIKLLLAKGADPAVKTSKGNNALLVAVKESQTECVQVLLAMLSAEQKSSFFNEELKGYNPLYYALKKSIPDCFELLLSHGANLLYMHKGDYLIKKKLSHEKWQQVLQKYGEKISFEDSLVGKAMHCIVQTAEKNKIEPTVNEALKRYPAELYTLYHQVRYLRGMKAHYRPHEAKVFLQDVCGYEKTRDAKTSFI